MCVFGGVYLVYVGVLVRVSLGLQYLGGYEVVRLFGCGVVLVGCGFLYSLGVYMFDLIHLSIHCSVII